MIEKNAMKTYKREIAVALLMYYIVMITVGIWFPAALVAAESIKIPAFTFAAGAFALDAGAKQFNERNT